MNIGPVSHSLREISVVEPVNSAFERVKQMLFRPFNLAKWFTIGFCAWLASLGESGAQFNSGNYFGNNSSAKPNEELHHYYNQAHDYVLANLYWIIPVAVFLVIFSLVLWLVLLWLNSRGKFMFVHCVALDKAEVSAPWHKFRESANSLFLFRVVLGIAAMILLLPPLAVVGLLIFRMISHGEPNVAAILIIAGLAMLFILFAIIFAIIQKFTADFIVPILFLRGDKCLAAWKEFWGLLRAHAGTFTLYILFQIVIGMAIGVIVLMAVLITCCLAGCLMLLPYIGTVLLLPVLVFKRAYSLYFLQQFGAAYDVFPPASTATPAVSGLQPLTETPPPPTA